MKERLNSQLHMLRKTIIFWIVFPVIVSLCLMLFIEITGRLIDSGPFFEKNGSGIVFLSVMVSILSAHLVFLAAVFGAISLFFGLPKDRNFLIVIFIGIIFGVTILQRIYL